MAKNTTAVFFWKLDDCVVEMLTVLYLYLEHHLGYYLPTTKWHFVGNSSLGYKVTDQKLGDIFLANFIEKI